MADNFLHLQLDENLLKHPEYRQGLSSHLPMALHALRALGADDAQLGTFHDRYARRLKNDDPWPGGSLPADWRTLRGQAGAWPALREHFSRQMDMQGPDELLRTVLPDLWPGVVAAAFHGLIRTAHAVESGHRGELAAALAYWAWRWQAVAAPDPGPPLHFDAWIASLGERSSGWHAEGNLIADRIAVAQRSPIYRELGGRLLHRPDSLQRLSAFGARRYAQTRHFTVLHLVTACRAARVLLPFSTDTGAARTALVEGFTAAYLTCGLPPDDQAELRSEGLPSLHELARAARQSEDEHVVKLVHACQDHEAAFGAGPWQAASARALGLSTE